MIDSGADTKACPPILLRLPAPLIIIAIAFLTVGAAAGAALFLAPARAWVGRDI